jgi:hypothetical protein
LVKTFVITLETGVAKQLSAALGVDERDAQRACLWMQPRATNTAPIYISSDDTVSSTNYGVRLEAPSGGIPPAPFNPGEFSVASGYGAKSPVKLSDFWALGLTGDFLHLLAMWY